MKKNKTIASVAAAAVVTSMSIFGAMALESNANGVINTDAQLKPAHRELKVSIDKDKVVKRSGRQFKLNAKTNDENYDVTYYSTDSKVASVSSNGTVRLQKKGKAKIIAECNGVTETCDIVVKKPKARAVASEGSSAQFKLNVNNMRNIESKIGHQTQHAYPQSTIMCSAYSFAYAYYQVTGILKPAGYFWSPGGCTWIGGTYHRYGSSGEMLNSIKSQIDSGKSCVGLLSTSSSPNHYVTFIGYTGSGTSLGDYTVLDPWDGSVRSGGSYGYCYIGYHVATINS